MTLRRDTADSAVRRGRLGRVGFVSTLTVTVSASMFLVFALGPLAPFIVTDLDISRAQLGSLTSLIFLAAAVCSPLAGRLIDRVGMKRPILVGFVIVIASLVTLGVSVSYAAVVSGVLIGGVAIAVSNPVTNKLVSSYVRPGEQGLILGVKQSGQQVSSFLSGFLLPAGAILLGWRGVLLASALVPLMGMGLAARYIPADQGEAPPSASRKRSSEQDRMVWVLSAYAMCMGGGIAVVTTYLPLFAFERLDYSTASAGAAAGLIGLFGIGGRIGWAFVAERYLPPVTVLVTLSVGGAIAAALIASATTVSPLLVWPGAALFGATSGAFMSVTNMTIVRGVPATGAGAASGAVMVAVFLGWVMTPLSAGFITDVTGSYQAAWVGVVALCAGATGVALGWGRWVTRAVLTGSDQGAIPYRTSQADGPILEGEE